MSGFDEYKTKTRARGNKAIQELGGIEKIRRIQG